jgi:hypothetical protein
LGVTTNTDTTIRGEFVVADEQTVRYEFVSISNSSTEYIEFQTTSVLFAEWRGFKIYHLHEDDITMELVHVEDAPHTIRIGRARNMSAAETATLESFLGTLLCEHFVELSIKLGAMGYTGELNQAVQDIHRFALWIWIVAAADGNIDISQWVDLDEEFEKVNTVNAASKKAGTRIQNMEQLMVHSSDMQSWDTGKKLLGNCGSPYSYCNNPCFGMCGKGCSCWSSVCGDCECWWGCLDHDLVCCTEGYFSYCCLNVFWVSCDGSGSC